MQLRLYGILLMGLLMMAACSQEDETVVDAVSADAVPIAFNCSVYTTRAANGYTGNLTAENQQLRYAGFGVFMGHDNASHPDIMYNQPVEFVFLSDGTGNGYWTYSPLKYWPAQAVGVCFYAYAPYVPKPETLPAGTTGIINMSSNDNPTPSISYARTRHPEDNVDLLWYCHEVTAADGFLTGDDHRPSMGKAVPLQMQHALARVRLSLGITNGTSLGSDKLLVKRITLKGNFAKTGTLELNHAGTTPVWNSQVLADPADMADDDNSIIFIDCHPDVNPDSYGIVAEAVRYIDGLPVSWQPAGLPHTNYDASDPDLKLNKSNLLCMGDALSYLYLIPQSDLSFTCVLDFCRISSENVVTNFSKTTATEATPIHITPLNGNTTYDVTLKITI